MLVEAFSKTQLIIINMIAKSTDNGPFFHNLRPMVLDIIIINY